jgi:hypothetical protein
LIIFSPPRCLKATVLQESEGEHRHERVAAPLEVADQSAQIGRGRQIGKVVLLLSGA